MLAALAGATPPLVDDWPKRLGDRVVSIARGEELWRPWLDPTVQRERFARSGLVARTFPADLRAATLAWFERGGELDDALEDAYQGVRSAAAALPNAHRALTETDLRTLPLWRLGSNLDVQRPIRRAQAKGQGGPLVERELGVAALADRDWDAAERGFRRAWSQSQDRSALHYWLYALCMDGRADEAARAAERYGVRAGKQPDDKAVWSFLAEHFPAFGEVGRAPLAGEVTPVRASGAR